MARTPKEVRAAYPQDTSAYTALGGKTRHYRINATGEEISRRQYLTATRGGISNEQYTKKPTQEKQRPSRGGRGKPSKQNRISQDGFMSLTNYKWLINYLPDKWQKFADQAVDILIDLPSMTIVQFKIQIKGNGIIAISGQVSKKGRLKWLIGNNEPAEGFLMNYRYGGFDEAINEAIAISAGYIDYPVVKRAFLQYKIPVSQIKKG